MAAIEPSWLSHLAKRCPAAFFCFRDGTSRAEAAAAHREVALVPSPDESWVCRWHGKEQHGTVPEGPLQKLTPHMTPLRKQLTWLIGHLHHSVANPSSKDMTWAGHEDCGKQWVMRDILGKRFPKKTVHLPVSGHRNSTTLAIRAGEDTTHFSVLAIRPLE